jgi:hypothetical protein
MRLSPLKQQVLPYLRLDSAVFVTAHAQLADGGGGRLRPVSR